MPNESDMRDLFNRWERVWHEGAFDLVETCVTPEYVRHDEMGDRTVSREAYAAELSKLRKARPDIRIVVYDHSFDGDRAWYRFTMRWTDQDSGEVRTRAGMQSYRTVSGKLGHHAANRLGLERSSGSGDLDDARAEVGANHPPCRS